MVTVAFQLTAARDIDGIVYSEWVMFYLVGDCCSLFRWAFL